MANYGLKHTGEFVDLNNTLYRVDIAVKNYAGTVFPLDFAADPAIIERNCDGIMSPFMTSGLKLTLWSNRDAEYLPLHITPPKEVKVTVYREGVMIFGGYVEPDLYEEDFQAPPYEITIRVADSLKGLEDYTPDGIISEDKMTLLEILFKCLSKAIELPINICCSLRTKVFELGEYDNIFSKSWINVEALVDEKSGVAQVKNAREILESILTSFGCRVYQARGEWFIERIYDRAIGHREYIRYDGRNVSKVSYATEKIILGDDLAPFFETAPRYEVVAPIGKQVIKQDLSDPYSLILNNFIEPFQVGAFDWKDHYDREVWFKKLPADNVRAFRNEHGIGRGFTIVHAVEGQTAFQCVDCTLDGGDTFSLEFKAAIEESPSNPVGDGHPEPDLRFRYELFVGSGHINKDGEPIYERVNGQEYIIEADFRKINLYEQPAKIALNGKEMKPAMGGGFTLVLHPAVAIRSGQILKTHYGDIQIKVNRMEFRLPLNSFVAESDKGFIREADELELTVNDAPLCPRILDFFDRRFEYRNVKNLLVYKTNIHNDSTINYYWYWPITGFYNNTETAEQARQLCEILLQDHFAQNYSARQTLVATILIPKESPVLLDPLRDYGVTCRSGLFTMLSDSFNLSEATHEIKVEELLSELIEIQHG